MHAHAHSTAPRRSDEDFGADRPRAARPPFLVEARHPDWTSSVLLDPKTGRARLTLNDCGGAYTLDDGILEIAWDAFPADRFRSLQGIFVQVDLIEKTAPPIKYILAEIPGSAYQATLRTVGSDISVYRQVFIDKEYETPCLPPAAAVIVDLGANIGLASLFFAVRYPGASLIALEPDPANYELLHRNLAALGGRSSALQAAIWSDDCELTVARHDATGAPLGDWGVQVGRSTNDGAAETATPQGVTGWSMARIIRDFALTHIDILKVDIEGAEKELFEAADLGWLAIVDLVLIETHERFRPGSHAAAMRLLSFGFELMPSSGENWVFQRPRAAVSATAPTVATGTEVGAPALILDRSKAIKISVSNFWPGFSTDRGFIKYLLDTTFENWSTSEAHADSDLILTSVFPHRPSPFPHKTLAVIWENMRPNYQCYGYSLSSDVDHYGKRNVRLPLWYSEIAWSPDYERWGVSGRGCHGHEPLLSLPSLLQPRSDPYRPRPKFCGFVASNPEAYRLMAAEALHRIRPVEAFGPITGRVEPRSKYDILRDFAFSLCFENSQFPGYHTEKLVQAWAAGTIPLYFGDISVARDFNSKAFVNRASFASLDAFVAHVERLDNNPELIEQMWREPLLNEPPSLEPVIGFLRETMRAIRRS